MKLYSTDLSLILRILTCRAVASCVLAACMVCATNNARLMAQSRESSPMERVWSQAVMDYDLKRDYKSSIIHYTEVIDIAPNHAEAYFRRGIAYSKVDSYQEAILDFTKAFQLQPLLVKLYPQQLSTFKHLETDIALFSGLMHIAAKRYAQAIPNFTTLLDNEPLRYASLHLYRAIARIQSGAVKEGCEECEMARRKGMVDVVLFETLRASCRSVIPVVLDELFPAERQLYPRGANDSAQMSLSGSISLRGYDSAYVRLFKNGTCIQRLSQQLQYKAGIATFHLRPILHAELSEYGVQVGLTAATKDTVIAVRDSIVCGDVLMVAGQSNAVVGGVPASPDDQFLRTISLQRDNIIWQRSSATNTVTATTIDQEEHVGGLAGELQRLIVQTYRVPVCIVKSAIGATPIQDHLPHEDHLWQSNLYGRTLYRTKSAGLQSAVKAIVWYQGESNDARGYYNDFERLYKAWERDYPNLRRVYAAQIRPSNCNEFPHIMLREIQRRLQDSLKGVEVFSTVGVPFHDGCHYADSGYIALGQQIFRLIARDFYGSTDTNNISSPTIRKAYYTSKEKTEIALVFSPRNSEIVTTADVVVANVAQPLHEYFFAEVSERGKIAPMPHVFSGVRTQGNIVFLRLKQPINIVSVGYLPDKFYHSTRVSYRGPWLINKRGVGVLSFFSIPVQNQP